MVIRKRRSIIDAEYFIATLYRLLTYDYRIPRPRLGAVAARPSSVKPAKSQPSSVKPNAAQSLPKAQQLQNERRRAGYEKLKADDNTVDSQ